MDYQLCLDWPDFLQRYWQKRPVILKRGFKNFIDPLSPDELAGLAMENEVDSRLVSHEEGRWQVSHGPFESFDHLVKITGRCWCKLLTIGMNLLLH